MVGHKMKLLQPDTEEATANFKRYSQQGVRMMISLLCRIKRPVRLKEAR